MGGEGLNITQDFSKYMYFCSQQKPQRPTSLTGLFDEALITYKSGRSWTDYLDIPETGADNDGSPTVCVRFHCGDHFLMQT